MSLTITIPGAVNVTTGAMAPAVLTIGVGIPGAAGPAGPGVPVGGTAGQYLQKIDGTNYNTDWVTLNLSAYAPLASPAFTGNPTAPTAALADNDTSLATTAFVQQELLSGTANAKNLEVYVRNQTGSTLAAGTIVYINGATGNRPTVTPAQANNDANSAQTMGFVKTSIANNGFGFVIVRGECEALDTSAVAEGTQLYLSPTTAGAYTTTKPVAPNHLVYVGIVIRSHPTQGVILVAVQNGYELDELHDVLITTPTNGQVLKYDSTSGLWVNGTDSAGVAWGGITGTLSSQTDLQTALDGKYSTTNPAGYITSSALTPYAPKASPTFTGLSVFNNPGNYAISIDNSAGYYTSISSGVYSIVNAAVEVIRLSAGGIKYPDGLTQSVAYPGSTDFLLKADNLSGLANTGTARTNLGLGTMAVETASNYLTTSTAASTYFTIASASNKADLASPALTGTPTAPTAAAATNTTQIATTAFVTTADNLKADLASPTFTGTPAAPTATAGTNTTQIATTAFVTAAVPAIATFAESQQLTSTTKVMSPFDTITAMMTEGYRPALGMTGGSSGTGAGVNPIMPQYIGLGGPNSGVAGSCHAVTNTAGGYITGVDPVSIKFNKPIWLSGSFRINTAGDSNNDFKAYIGTSMLNGNDPTGPSIGWYRQGGASMPISLMVHNGTTLTKVASASSYGSGSTAVIRYMVYSDGAGNVTLYINGTSVATTALGPTGSTTAAVAQFTASTSSTASSTARVYFDLYHPKIFIAPQ
jgi:hypothetical protein